MVAHEIANIDAHSPYHTLLSNAIVNWNSEDMFSDEQVQEVKAAFHKVFGHEKPLKGSAIRDAIMLKSEEDPTLFYIAQLPEGDFPVVIWMKVAVCNVNFAMSNDISVEEFFMFKSESCSGHDDRIGDPTEAFLRDFFGVWRRHYSPERIRRVTGREPNDPRPLLQNNATLDRMLKETSLLGFYGSLRIEVEDTHSVKCYSSEENVKNL